MRVVTFFARKVPAILVFGAFLILTGIQLVQIKGSHGEA